MTKPREKETGLQGLRWSLVMFPNEYFYIGFWILVSGNTKGNWEYYYKILFNKVLNMDFPLPSPYLGMLYQRSRVACRMCSDASFNENPKWVR